MSPDASGQYRTFLSPCCGGGDGAGPGEEGMGKTKVSRVCGLGGLGLEVAGEERAEVVRREAGAQPGEQSN